MCVYIYKLSNAEHTEWYDRFSINVAFSLFPEALAKHITFESEMNYCSNTGKAGWSVMACCFTGSQIWWSNCSFKSLKQQTSIISKTISNNYSKSQSQGQMFIFHTYCPEIILWKHHDMGYCDHVFKDPWFLCTQQGVNSQSCHPPFGSVFFFIATYEAAWEAAWTEQAKALIATWQKAAHNLSQEFISHRFYSYIQIQ